MFALSCLLPRAASGDVASWLYVGAGPSLIDDGRASPEHQASVELTTGFGSPPDRAFIVGGLARVQPHFGRGTDLGLLVRSALGSYQRGGFGGALDLGGYQRWWGRGSTGAIGTLSLGAPYGLTLNLTAALGTNDAQTYGATFGIDFARLTIYRTSGVNWWSNPFPAVRETAH